ncbi:MAG: N-acetylglucosamine-6-phosphate deacetylase [Armatimonadota bacterium]
MTQNGRWVLQGGTLLLSDGIRGPGFVTVEADRIVSVESGRHPQPDLDCSNGTLVPGFIDLQINGAAGCDFLSPTESGLAAADAYLLRTGTVAYLPTLISAAEDRLRAALGFFATRARRPSAPRILGVHLEGPFLAPARRGAHRSAYLHTPSMEWIGKLIDDFRGLIRLVTLAPELDGALPVIDGLVTRGVAVAVGHTDATYAQAMAAFDRGARLATHLFNGMRPFHHREPGVVGAALARPDVTCSFIADLVHLHPGVLQHIITLKGPARALLITDAIDAAGVPAGPSRLGDQHVRVEHGAPRLADGRLAGSVLAMDQAVRNIRALGVSLPDAVHMAAATPAHVIGGHDASIEASIREGARADLVVLDDHEQVAVVVVAGRVAFRR